MWHEFPRRFTHFTDQQRAAGELARVLRKGGRVVLRGVVRGLTSLSWLALFPGRDKATMAPLWQLLAVVPVTVLVVAVLTIVPARLGARRPVAEILQSELA